MNDDRLTWGERYATAISASNLRLGPGRGPIDIIAASGMGGDSFGTILCRIRAEFDLVRAQYGVEGGNDATSRLLVLMRLSSLDAAKAAVGRLAVLVSARREESLGADVVLRIAGRCLDLYLDPICGGCQGRGYNGAGRGIHQGLQVNCRNCGGTPTEQGSGNRVENVGRDPNEREFGRELLALMRGAAEHAQGESAARMG